MKTEKVYAASTEPRIEEIPVPEKVLEASRNGKVYSVHPRMPENIQYIGTNKGIHGWSYDYYEDNNGTYWYESRPEDAPIVRRWYRVTRKIKKERCEKRP